MWAPANGAEINPVGASLVGALNAGTRATTRVAPTDGGGKCQPLRPASFFNTMLVSQKTFRKEYPNDERSH